LKQRQTGAPRQSSPSIGAGRAQQGRHAVDRHLATNSTLADLRRALAR
jgi:hypothetical protein